MDQAFYGVNALYLFPRYQTREAYRKETGREPPEFNPALSPKFWEDPDAIKSTLRNILYFRVIAMNDRGNPAHSPGNNPMLEPLTLPKTQAASVNIPPEGTNIPGADAYEVPVPLRELQPYEKLVFRFGGVLAVRDTRVPPSVASGDFTEDDRAVLNAIAQKVGAL
jgi:hypothetical protein